MPETTEQSRLNWIAALERMEELKPHAVVAGHMNPIVRYFEKFEVK
jgi:hypothetical protein